MGGRLRSSREGGGECHASPRVRRVPLHHHIACDGVVRARAWTKHVLGANACYVIRVETNGKMVCLVFHSGRT